MEEHRRKLEQMYMNAPVQKLYKGIKLKVSEGSAIITLPVDPIFFHAGNSLHGSVYFRLLDDAAYFSANSLVTDNFMLTSSFHIDLLRPVTKGVLRAIGKVISQSKNVFLAQSELYDDRDRLVATGKGTFLKSKHTLDKISGYE